MTTEPTAKHEEKVQELPSWEDCEAAVDKGRATPLEEFIYDHEPADTHDPEWRQDLQAALSSRDREIREVLEGRLAYVESKDLCNGWSGNESGPCCEKCELRDEHLTGRADFLKAAAGCRNPFQLPKVCQCHIPTRQAVKNGQVEILRQVLTALKKS